MISHPKMHGPPRPPLTFPLTPPPLPFQLATEAETPEDREIICEEVFSDVVGALDAKAQVWRVCEV